MVLATRCGLSFTFGHAGAVAWRQVRVACLGLLLAGLAGCGDRPTREAGGEPSPPVEQVAAPSAEPFVVFSSPSITIDRLEVPVPVPATVGSSPSPETLSSDAPEVVSVDASGALVGHRAGGATVRTPDGRSALEVEVRPVSAFAVVPARLALRPGGKGRLRLAVAGSGEELPAGAAQWTSDAPDIALVFGGEVEAGARQGAANVLVSYGGQAARAVVVVVERPPRAEGAPVQSRIPAR